MAPPQQKKTPIPLNHNLPPNFPPKKTNHHHQTTQRKHGKSTLWASQAVKQLYDVKCAKVNTLIRPDGFLGQGFLATIHRKPGIPPNGGGQMDQGSVLKIPGTISGLGILLGGGFKDFLFSPLPGKMIQFD